MTLCSFSFGKPAFLLQNTTMKNELQRLLNLLPFEPFVVHLSSGRDIEVTHSEAVTLFPFRMDVAIGWKPDHTADTLESVSYLHIASIRPITTAK